MAVSAAENMVELPSTYELPEMVPKEQNIRVEDQKPPPRRKPNYNKNRIRHLQTTISGSRRIKHNKL